MAEDNGRRRDIEKDLTGRLFAQYEAKAKSVRTTFSWLLTFAGFFLVFVIVPFMSIQYELLTLPPRIAQLEAETAARMAAVSAATRSHDGFVRLGQDIRSGPQQMRDFLIRSRGNYEVVKARWLQLRSNADITAGASGQSPPYAQTGQMAVQPLPDTGQWSNAPMPSANSDPLLESIDIPADCVSVAEAALMGCLVADLGRKLFQGYAGTLEQEVLEPLDSAGLLSLLNTDRETLRRGLGELQQRLEARLLEKPEFWMSVDEKASFFDAVGRDMEELWGRYDRTIEELNRALAAEAQGLQAAQGELDARRTEMAKLRDEFKARLKEIETPFGRLPVGLNEALLGFPVLLAVGFLVCVVQLADARRLRAAFVAVYRRADPEGTVLGDPEVTLVAPLWPSPERRGGLLLMLAPFLVFAVAVGVVLYSWRMTESFRGVGSLSLAVFFALYAVSLVVFLLALWQLFRRAPAER